MAHSGGTRGSSLVVGAKAKELPKKSQIFIDDRSGARVREFEFDLSNVPVSSRSAKGLTVTKWPVKEAKRVDLALG